MKFQEWQGGSGVWYVAADFNAKGEQVKWWYPARKLNMELTDYIKMLQSYGASQFKYNGDLLIFSFDKYNDAHKLLLYLNRMARNNNW